MKRAKLSTAVDAFIADFTAEGRINSPHTILAYRTKLDHLAQVTGNRDPANIDGDDIKTALSRWERNSRKQAHSIYRSFFSYCLTEGIRTTNPADHVRPTKGAQPKVGRITREETARLLTASNDKRRDRWLAHLGCCAGLRSHELRLIQGRHFARPGFVHVQLGKGQKERWIPVIADLVPVVEEILTLVALDEFVLPGQRSAGHPNPGIMRDTAKPVSASAVYKQTVALGERAGIGVRVTPHVLRRSFATHVARYAGVRVAQSLLGHVSIETTRGYTDDPTLDELAVSLHGISFHEAVLPSPTRENPR